MLAFYDDETIKSRFIRIVRKNQNDGVIVQDAQVASGNLCAISAVVGLFSFSMYAEQTGIPEWLVRVKSYFFENMEPKDSIKWVSMFLCSAQAGSDLNKIKDPFILFILKQNSHCLSCCRFDEIRFKEVKSTFIKCQTVTDRMISIYETGSKNAIPEVAKLAKAVSLEAAEHIELLKKLWRENVSRNRKSFKLMDVLQTIRKCSLSAWSAAEAPEWLQPQSALHYSPRLGKYNLYSKHLRELMQDCKKQI